MWSSGRRRGVLFQFFSARGHCEQSWNGQESPLFESDVVHPAFSLPPTVSPTFQRAPSPLFEPDVVHLAFSLLPTALPTFQGAPSPLFYFVHPAFSPPPTVSPTFQGALKGGFGEYMTPALIQ